MNTFFGYRTFQQVNRIVSRFVAISTDDFGRGGAVILRLA